MPTRLRFSRITFSIPLVGINRRLRALLAHPILSPRFVLWQVTELIFRRRKRRLHSLHVPPYSLMHHPDGDGDADDGSDAEADADAHPPAVIEAVFCLLLVVPELVEIGVAAFEVPVCALVAGALPGCDGGVAVEGEVAVDVDSAGVMVVDHHD